MSARTAVGVADLLLGAAFGTYWLGHLRATKAANRALLEANPSLPGPTSPPTGATAWEEQTVLITNDLRRQMSQWAKDGVVVLSPSGPVTQKDGATSSHARVRAPKN